MDFINELAITETIIKSDNKHVIQFQLQKYPSYVQQLMLEDFDILKKIVKFIYEDILTKKKFLELSLEDVISSYQFIENPNNQKKSQYIRFQQTILIWLKEQHFFEKTYNNINTTDHVILTNDIDDIEINIPNETDDDKYIEESSEDLIESIIELQNPEETKKFERFVFRQNQQDALELLEKEGIKTGIHCQATGCGKTAIIKKYIEFNEQLYVNSEKTSKVILFTERKNIFADLFSFKDINENHSQEHKDNIKRWYITGECDLRNYKIINRVTIKKKDWLDILNNETKKPILLVINRAYLTLNDYKKLTKNHVNLVIHDECHNTSSKQCHEFLKHIKNLNVSIVGFSATPVRTGKGDRPLLLEIYHKDNDNTKLNLLTNYNMMKAISDDLILAPEFHWYVINKYNKKNQEDTNSGEIEKKDVESAMNLLNNIIPKLPYKKIIAWCGLISMSNKWTNIFEQNKYKFVNLKDLTSGKDTSMTGGDDYDKFKNSDGKSILFCANKHREGSDIKKLDGCIFLDKVKNRGAIPFIQSIGRVLRKTDDDLKNNGIIIDCVAKEGDNYDKEVVDKIIGYYLALQNMAKPEDIIEQKIKMYTRILSDVNFNNKKKNIILNIGDKKNQITISCNTLEWNNIITKFDKVLREKFDIKHKEYFNIVVNILKNLNIFSTNTNFWKTYEDIPNKQSLGLPDELYTVFKDTWDNKTWYEVLGVDTSKTKSLGEIKKIVWMSEKSYDINKDKYLKLAYTYQLPHYPEELYKFHGVKLTNNILMF